MTNKFKINPKYLILLVVLMIGLSFASVPLYDLFCRVTGFGGTTQKAENSPNKILNKTSLRNKKEFVNHKILDCMGDLYLSGYKIIGKIKCSQGGHKLTNDLLRKVFADKSNYSIIEIDEKSVPHTLINKQKLKSIA